MAYEVTKVVRGHSYRYQVQSYRDESGKVRNRWTYLGRVDGSTTRAPSRRSTAQTRDRLIDALGRLLERGDYSTVTAGAIAAEAGYAHGTFYRYFKHKRDALEAAVSRINEAIEHNSELLRLPIGSADEERARLRSVVGGALDSAVAQPGVTRTWLALQLTSPELMQARLARRERALAVFADYLTRLRDAGYTDITNPSEVAAAITAAIGGAIHLAVQAGVPVSEQAREGIQSVAERSVFHRDFTGRLRDETGQASRVSN